MSPVDTRDEVAITMEEAQKALRQGRLDRAQRMLDEALEDRPDHPAALHLLGILHRRRGETRPAIDRFQRALAVAGDHPVYLKNLGNAFKDDGQLGQALASFRRALELSPHYTEALYDMGCVYQLQGSLEEAAQCYRKALTINPDLSEALINLGLILESQENLAAAEACYRKAQGIDPQSSMAANNLGNVLFKKGALEEALTCYRGAIQRQPHLANAFNNAGFALSALGRASEAVESFARAHLLLPQSEAIHINLANAYVSAGMHRKALSCFETILAENPGCKEALFNMGIAWEGLDEPREAINSYIKALAIDPQYEKACSHLVRLLIATCSWDRLADHADRLDHFTGKALNQGRKPAETPFLNITRQADPEQNLLLAKAWAHEIEMAAGPAMQPRATANDASRGDKIRVGYLSNNFRNHPTAQLMAELFRLHDRSRFEVLCFSYGIDDASAPRKKIERSCDRFIDLRHMSDDQAAQSIAKQGVAILVDLCGFTNGARMGIAARRPAPLQVRYLGMAGTSGAAFFDYLIADQIVVPQSSAAHYREKLIYMPHCYQVNSYGGDEMIARSGRRQFGLPRQGRVFCCFNLPYKLDAKLFRSWMRILAGVEGSVLWLMATDGLTMENLRAAVRDAGIPEERLLFAAKLPKKEHLKRLFLCDLALDTRFVTGAATTSDALWAHVPVLTIAGNHFASRMSASILRAVGLESLVAEDRDQYEALALELGNDTTRLDAIRRQLARNIQQQPLFDTRRFTTDLERAYAAIWENHLRGDPPAFLDLCANSDKGPR